ncbi:DUF6716 putative glycosyltransferase [Nocardiopsis sp. MG754419]|uniref:DUF6716 putative glycosyltransferase n=1 Tax=Nocardiopsis sp. MG754419 TaxID=2259865 RepID=UPI001BA49AE2|nr:DUF6716 putative glycosyltransferase [Nocardiopsis sp. MG754419]MBR8743601.1 hypothetical protein [Nocardiopsis sp. MG754419]
MSLVPTWSRAPGGAPAVLAIADSAPRARMSAMMLGDLPDAGGAMGLAVLRSADTPSPDRIRAALEGTRHAGRRIPLLTAGQVRKLIRRRRPDAVLLNCSGPHIEALSWSSRPFLRRYRPVVVSALPVPGLPASEGEWLHRSRVDLLVAHSHREVDEYTVLGEKLGLKGRVGLAGLYPDRDDPYTGGPRDRVVFAARPGLPAGTLGCEALLLALARLAADRPDLDVVLHIGEEGHPELIEVLAALVASAGVPRTALTVETGPLRDRLDRARGVAALGSVPILEAIAARVPSLVLTDFGVGWDQGNVVFEGSGLFGDLTDLRACRFHKPSRAWGERNHFHPPSHDDWAAHLYELCGRAGRGTLA